MTNTLHAPIFGCAISRGFRILPTLIATLAIIIGSWLETYQTSSCSVQRSMSMQQVVLSRSTFPNTTIPDEVTFGLWQYCVFYSNRCACSPIRLTFDIDIPTVFQTVMGGTGVPDTATSTYIRAIPLILASAMAGAAVLFGGFVIYDALPRYHYLTAALVFVSAILASLATGYTYHFYLEGIKLACGIVGNVCSATHVGVQFILLIVGIGWAVLGSMLWLMCLPSKDVSFEEASTASPSESVLSMTESKTNRALATYDHHGSFAHWQEHSQLDGPVKQWQRKGSLCDEHALRYNGFRSHFAPPPVEKQMAFRRRYSFSNPSSTESSNLRSSAGDLESLAPPVLPYAARRSSHGSGHTFGACSQTQDQRYSQSFSIHADTPSPQQTPRSLHTPQSDYFCLTPMGNSSNVTQSDSSTSRRRRSSSDILSDMQRGRSPSPMDTAARYCRAPSNPSLVPTLNLPPLQRMRHPLNHKVITDKRINEYLQDPPQL